MSNLLLTGCGGGAGGTASLLDDAYYWKATASPTPPDPLTTAGWTLTTQVDDVGVNDQTTFESGGAGEYLHILYYRTTAKTFQSWTAAVNSSDAPTVTLVYWDGAAYQSWDTPLVALGWQNISGNPADQSSKAIVLTILDAVASAVGDFRPTHA
jgi:hypothetical protein